jgi:uncharacterized protein YfeS
MVLNVTFCSLQEQLELKSQLDCKPFQWYMENIFPELKYVSNHISLSNKLQIQILHSTHTVYYYVLYGSE